MTMRIDANSRIQPQARVHKVKVSISSEILLDGRTQGEGGEERRSVYQSPDGLEALHGVMVKAGNDCRARVEVIHVVQPLAQSQWYNSIHTCL
jgi:hypothetical protein